MTKEEMQDIRLMDLYKIEDKKDLHLIINNIIGVTYWETYYKNLWKVKQTYQQVVLSVHWY